VPTLPQTLIRILIVEDHPAVRAGLAALLDAEPDLAVVGLADSAADVWPKLYGGAPDLVLLDYHLPLSDGLTVCSRLKREVPTPRVVLYSAFADEALLVPATLAGADALLPKGAPTHELLAAIRRVADGECLLPVIPPAVLQAMHRRLDPDDVPIVGMALHATPLPDIARVLSLEVSEVSARLERLIARLAEPATSSQER